jgi:phosphohistidine phosphatase
VAPVELYLIQHGQAVAEEIDPNRPLTDCGRAEVRRVAQAAAEHGVAVRTVCHSGKRRAVETAAILAEEVARGQSPEKMAGLAPKDDPRRTAEAVEAMEEPVALVGHMPHLSRLVSVLVVEDPDREIVAFRQGGLVKLVRDERWRVAWILVPELAG